MSAITIWKPGTHVALDRDWATYRRGNCFVIAKAIDCGQIQQADGSFINPVNLRVVLVGEDLQNERAHRTLPAEYVHALPYVGQELQVEANQGIRDGTVLAVCGTQVLIEYEMPAGRTYGRILDVLKPGWYRAVCMSNLPAKWEKELAA